MNDEDLQGSVLADVIWMLDAACRTLAVDEFFVAPGRVIAAGVLALCEKCVVRDQCREHAEKRELRSGYFGGLSPKQRTRIG